MLRLPRRLFQEEEHKIWRPEVWNSQGAGVVRRSEGPTTRSAGVQRLDAIRLWNSVRECLGSGRGPLEFVAMIGGVTGFSGQGAGMPGIFNSLHDEELSVAPLHWTPTSVQKPVYDDPSPQLSCVLHINTECFCNIV